MSCPMTHSPCGLSFMWTPFMWRSRWTFWPNRLSQRWHENGRSLVWTNLTCLSSSAFGDLIFSIIKSLTWLSRTNMGHWKEMSVCLHATYHMTSDSGKVPSVRSMSQTPTQTVNRHKISALNSPNGLSFMCTPVMWTSRWTFCPNRLSQRWHE